VTDATPDQPPDILESRRWHGGCDPAGRDVHPAGGGSSHVITPPLPVAKVLQRAPHGCQGQRQGNDAPAIQQAIDAATRSPGAVVYLPKGTYRIERSLVVEHPVRIVGAGAEITTVLDRDGMHMIELWNTSDVEIRGLTLDGAHSISDMGHGVRMNDVTRLTIANCRFVNIPDTGLSLGHVEQATITGCHFENIGMSGIRLQHPGDEVANRDILIDGNTFINTVTTHARGHAAIQSQGGLARHEHITITNNTIASQYVGIGLDSLDHSTVANNRVTGNLERGEGIAFTGAHNVIAGNVINNNDAAGILQWAVAYRPNNDNRIEGNTCWDNAQGIAIVCGEPGTLIENLTIAGNRCFAESEDHPQPFGIQSYINPTREFTWKNVVITGNDLRGNAVRAISLIPPSEARIEDNLT